MAKIRVYELARELQMESKLLVARLKEMKISVSSHQSTLDPDQVVKAKKLIQSDSGESGGKSSKVIRRKRKADEPVPTLDKEAKPVLKRRVAAVSEDSQAVAEPIEKDSSSAKEDAPDLSASTSSSGGSVEQIESTNEVISSSSAVESDSRSQVSIEDSTKIDSNTETTGTDSSIQVKDQQETKEEHNLTSSKADGVEIDKQSLDIGSTKVGESTIQLNTETLSGSKQASVTPISDSNTARTTTDKKSRDPKEISAKGTSDKKSDSEPASGKTAPAKTGSEFKRATIVRKASPEEIRRNQTRFSRPRRPGDSPRGENRPEGTYSRRPRPDGGGYTPRSSGSSSNDSRNARGGDSPGYSKDRFDRGSSNDRSGSRPGKSSFKSPDPIAPAIDGFSKPTAERSYAKDKKRVLGGPPKQSEEELAKKAIAKTPKRTFQNTKVLLNNLDSENDEGIRSPRKKKTVYTPQTNRKRDLRRRKDLKKTQITTPRAAYRIVKMGGAITIAELGKQLGVKGAELIKKLMAQGMMVTLNQEIDFDSASLIAGEYEFEVQSTIVSEDDILTKIKDQQGDVETTERPPIVTIMGHVDHGKTSILDAIRKSKVADKEAGGITQHIGAYTVNYNDKKIAFLDTPGHEAFSNMRSRGAKVTDIVVLVVAADDGVKPQTIEAISHAQAANVPIIVAINKMDKPGINLDRVFTELTERGIQSEEWGGDTQFVKVSALQQTGLDDLLDSILLQSEILELKATVDAPALGVVIEAHLDKGRGPVATIMVQDGTLEIGQFIVCGNSIGKVRAMHDHHNKMIKIAPPSTPVEVIGLSEVPSVGDAVNVVADEKVGRELAAVREDRERNIAASTSSAATIEELLEKARQEDKLEVPVIIKADTQGTAEAISESIVKVSTDRVNNKIIHKGVGGINESDISLASASKAIIIGFNVRATKNLADFAESMGVPIEYHSVIYDIVDRVKFYMTGKLPPVLTEVIQGQAEVRATIKVPKIGLVAGSAVIDGKITRNSNLRVIRQSVVVYSGKIGSLRRFKEDVREVATGYECGIGIDGYNDVREGDIIESYIVEESRASL